jgi:hypothetical protein
MRTVLIPTSDLITDIVIPALQPYIGVAAVIADHTALVEAVLDEYFFDTRAAPAMGVVAQLRAYGLPTDTMAAIHTQLGMAIPRLVQAAFEIVYPSRSYRYEFDRNGDVAIIESIPR